MFYMLVFHQPCCRILESVMSCLKMAKDLKAHMILHDEKKTHSCNQCGYSSIRADKLKRHMLVHSGAKPFSCAHCNYFFSRADGLKTHKPREGVLTKNTFQFGYCPNYPTPLPQPPIWATLQTFSAVDS